MTNRVDLPANTWVDVYAEIGEAEGTAMVIQNITGVDVYITESATEPASSFGQALTAKGTEHSTATVGEGSSSIWLRAIGNNSVVAVEV